MSPQTQSYLPFEYQVHLFEGAGVLAAVSQDKQFLEVRSNQSHCVLRRVLETLLGPLLNQLNEILSKQLYKQDTPTNPVYSTLLANSITALIHVNKGTTPY